MEVIIAAHKIGPTEALKDYIEKKLKRIAKFSDKFFQAEAHLEKVKQQNQFRLSIKGANKPLMATAESEDSMYAAIDACIDKLEKQLRRGKDDHSKEREKKMHHEKRSLQ